jgi:hypothetical protein
MGSNHSGDHSHVGSGHSHVGLSVGESNSNNNSYPNLDVVKSNGGSVSIEPYLEHRRNHGGQGPIPCPQCGKLFAKEFDIKRHMFTHTGEKPFKCEICNRGFSQKSTLKVHLNIHTGDMPYACSMCHKKFRQKQGLNAHVKANRCKFGQISQFRSEVGSTSSSNSSSSSALGPMRLSPTSSSSERSASPNQTRSIPYPTQTTRYRGQTGNSSGTRPMTPDALLKLIGQPITVQNRSPSFDLGAKQNISLLGLQNLSNLIQTLRQQWTPPSSGAPAPASSLSPSTSGILSSNSGLPPTGTEATIEELNETKVPEAQIEIVKVNSDVPNNTDNFESQLRETEEAALDNRSSNRRKQANPSKLID